MNNVSPILKWLESRGYTPGSYIREVILARLCFIVMMYALLFSMMPVVKHYNKVLFPPTPSGSAPTISPQMVLVMTSIGLYINTIYLIALPSFSGWRKLARAFPAPEAFRGDQRFKKQDVIVGTWKYRAITVGVSPQGLFLEETFPVRITHRPILIPWGAVASVHQRQFSGWTITHLVIGSPRMRSITLKNEELLKAVSPWMRQGLADSSHNSAPSAL